MATEHVAEVIAAGLVVTESVCGTTEALGGVGSLVGSGCHTHTLAATIRQEVPHSTLPGE